MSVKEVGGGESIFNYTHSLTPKLFKLPHVYEENKKKIERKIWIQCTTLTTVFLSLILIQSEKCWGDGLKDKKRHKVGRGKTCVWCGVRGLDAAKKYSFVLMIHTLSCSHKQCKGKYTSRGSHHYMRSLTRIFGAEL